MRITFRTIIGVFLSFEMIACSMEKSALKEQGLYPSPGKACTAELKSSPQGGFLQLFVQSSLGTSAHIADDVTGVMWIGQDSLVFSSSPIYGNPGIFEIKCDHDGQYLTTLVNPKNINSAYPDGADYFELRGTKDNILEFYYGFDVDSIDFNTFRTENNLHSKSFPIQNESMKIN